MNIKTVALGISLSLSFASHGAIFQWWKSAVCEPEKKSLQWLHWSIQNHPDGLNNSEIKNNRDHYINLIKQHRDVMLIKQSCRNSIIEYKWNKGIVELEGATLAGLLAYCFYLKKEYEEKYSYLEDNRYLLLSCAFSLLGSVPLGYGIKNICKSYMYEQRIDEKLARDTKILEVLELL